MKRLAGGIALVLVLLPGVAGAADKPLEFGSDYVPQELGCTVPNTNLLCNVSFNPSETTAKNLRTAAIRVFAEPGRVCREERRPPPAGAGGGLDLHGGTMPPRVRYRVTNTSVGSSG